MSEQEIIEGNRLIAEWLGYEIDPLAEEDEPIRYYVDDHIECVADGIDYWETFEEDWTSWLYPEQMKFHSSWDWLMPVIDKIEAEYYNSHMSEWVYDKCLGVDFCILRYSLQEAYKQVIEFIKWYTSCQKEK